MRPRLPHAISYSGYLLAGSLVGAIACATPGLRPVPPSRQEVLRTAKPPAPGAPSGVTAFVNVAVVPMDTERVLEGQTVVVEQGRIAALGPSGQVRVPSGAGRVEGRGKVLIPGLSDCHAHLSLETRLGWRSWGEAALSRSDRLLLKEQQLFLWLAHGLTTVRLLDYGKGSLGSDVRGEEVLHLRAQAAAGKLLSPRIYTAGNLMDGLSHPDSIGKLQLSQVAEAVRAYKARGYDFIKVHPIYIPTAVLDSLAATARRADLPLVGHTIAPMERVLATYRSIEHLTGYAGQQGYTAVLATPGSMEALDQLAPRIRELAVATQRAGVWNCPTLYNSILNHGSDVQKELLRRVIKALQEAGAGLLAGSDRLQGPRTDSEMVQAGLTPAQQQREIVYGQVGATHRELQELVKSGLTPYQALAASTRNVAAYFGTLDSTGTITVGKRADLVLLESNPLADIRQTERIAGVMLGGRWLDRAELDRRIAEIRTPPAAAAAAGRYRANPFAP